MRAMLFVSSLVVAGEYFVRLGKALAIEYQTDHDLLAVVVR